MQLVGKILKIEALAHQFRFCCFGFAFNIKFAQNAVVLAQPVIDIAHKVITVFIYLVVPCVAAGIAAKLLVFAAYNLFAALRAVSCHYLVFLFW